MCTFILTRADIGISKNSRAIVQNPLRIINFTVKCKLNFKDISFKINFEASFLSFLPKIIQKNPLELEL